MFEEPLDGNLPYHHHVGAEPNPKYRCKCGNERLFTRKADSREVWLVDNQGEYRDTLTAHAVDQKRVRCFFCGKIVKPVKEAPNA